MAVNVVSFSFSRAAQPEAQRPTLLGDLLHLISNFSAPQLNRGPRAPSAWCGFSYHISSITRRLQLQLWLLSWLSYIIVERPLNRLLDLWNGMIDPHPAEITVTGHSLPEHQSMSVPWDFFLPRPISSANFRPRDFLSYLPLECVTSFRCITLEWHFGPGRRPKYNTDHLFSARRPDFIIINKKERSCRIVDFDVPADHRVKLKESDKMDKYLDHARELKKNCGTWTWRWYL